ncbi:MAG: hypothetical protein NVS3B20_02450 [Polyangiales bacterium]
MNTARHHSSLLFAATALVSMVGACDSEITVDKKTDNPGIFAPAGIIHGTLSYIGPGPCIKDGRVEGVALVLLFDAANPPPPDGLATTALNFATVPGERLFISYPRPTKGPGSPGDPRSYCPAIDSPTVTASADYTLSELTAGRYQVRGFYSRQNRFNPLFDFSNLPLATDIGGGVLVDPRAATPKFATITVGNTDAKGNLYIPPSGFVADGVPLILGQVLTTGRPYFYIDREASQGFQNPKAPTKGEPGVPYPSDEPVAGLIFPQDHPLTGEAGGPPENLFGTAQKSFPTIKFKYGFPGGEPVNPTGDAWLAKNAKPSDPFFADRVRPYYGIDPLAPLTPLSTNFVLTRAMSPEGAPAVLHDNELFEALSVAQLYPLVVLAKLQENADGVLIDPPTAQTNPVVVVQGITIRKDILQANTSAANDGGGIASANPVLASAVELYDGFTALMRTAAFCLNPAKSFRGTLAVPFKTDFNPKNAGVTLVDEVRLAKYQPQIEKVAFGCLPPGLYSVNVIYPTGQAWSLPNQTGYCTYTLAGKLSESCFTPTTAGPQDAKGFTSRPLLTSQQVYRKEGGKMVPQVVQVTPSERCMAKSVSGAKVVWTNHPRNEDANANGISDPGEDTDGDGLDLNIPEACWPKGSKFVQNK